MRCRGITMCHAILVNEFILEIHKNNSIANNGTYMCILLFVYYALQLTLRYNITYYVCVRNSQV